MSRVLKEPDPTIGELKETSIEGVLKGLQGKTLTKKSIFDLLLGININELSNTKVINQDADIKTNKNELEPIKKQVKGKKKREKKNKQEELSKFFDSIANSICIPKAQEQLQKEADIETIYPNVEWELDTIIQPTNIYAKTIIIPVNVEDSDSDLELEQSREIYDDISVILYPMGIKRPINIKPKEPIELKCKACKKTFTVESSLKRHYKRYPECLDFLALPSSADNVKLERGIHFIVDDLLNEAICLNGEKVCKWCKTKYKNIGNLHKHLTTSKVCNKMAFQDFKKLVLSLEV
jgi:hypothetical protein